MLSTTDGSIDLLAILSTNDESIDDLLAMLSTTDESIDDLLAMPSTTDGNSHAIDVITSY